MASNDISVGSGVARFAFAIKQGSDFIMPLTWLDDNGAPMDLSGFSMRLSIRTAASAPTILLTLDSASTTGSRIVLGGADGTITLIFARSDTAVLVPSGFPAPSISQGLQGLLPLGVYDLQYTDFNGDVGYLLAGPVSLEPSVTQ